MPFVTSLCSTLAGQLSARFPGQLVFKGGFVLRHVHGLVRFSKDVDATRHEPAHEHLEAEQVALAIEEASIRNVVQFSPGEPARDTENSLDFDKVRVSGDTFQSATVQVEVSYREGVVEKPVDALIGNPFYENFESQRWWSTRWQLKRSEPWPSDGEPPISRTSWQRRNNQLRPMGLSSASPSPSSSSLLRAGRGTRRKSGSPATSTRWPKPTTSKCPNFLPDVPSYGEAMDIVWPRIEPLIPSG